jgi:alpha-L-fucosidase 2
VSPAWGSKYTININTEMNYWPAEVANLAECHEPLFDLIEELRAPGRRTAKAHYGARGFVAHHNTDLWRVATPVDGARWGLWPMGAAWLSTHLFEHYAFGGDVSFLRRAYPVLKEASEFLLDFLVEDDKGRLVTNPSHSPENAFLDEKGNEGVLCVGATMDFGIIREPSVERIVVVRLTYGSDVLEGLARAVREERIESAVILSGIGSLKSYHVHAVSSVELPSTNVFFKGQGPYDLTAVNGYVVGGRVHAHVTFSNDKQA